MTQLVFYTIYKENSLQDEILRLYLLLKVYNQSDIFFISSRLILYDSTFDYKLITNILLETFLNYLSNYISKIEVRNIKIKSPYIGIKKR